MSLTRLRPRGLIDFHNRLRFDYDSHAWLFIILTQFILAIFSLTYGNVSVDEVMHFDQVAEQIKFANQILQGQSPNHSDIKYDFEYYGLGVSFIAYTLSYLIDIVLLNQDIHKWTGSFSYLLHFFSIIHAFIAVYLVRASVLFITNSLPRANIATFIMATWPIWFGYGLFNYKDIPIATALIAGFYTLVRFRAEPSLVRACMFLFALWWMAQQRFAGLVLAIPLFIGFLYTYRTSEKLNPQNRSSIILCVPLLAILIWVTTPCAWLEPFRYFKENLLYMSNHHWSGCTLTNFACIGRYNNPHWSALAYLVQWWGVQTPLLYLPLIGLALITPFLKYKTLKFEYIAVLATLLVAVLLIIVRNSTLYDGVRHTLFIIPLLAVIIGCGLPDLVIRAQKWIAAYCGLIFIQSLPLYPYQYTWFNEVSIVVPTDQKRYETDYWGYSLAEAVQSAKATWPEIKTITGFPTYLIGPLIYPGENPKSLGHYATDTVIENDRFSLETMDKGTEFLWIALMRVNASAPANCTEVRPITRQAFFARAPVTMALVAKCKK